MVSPATCGNTHSPLSRRNAYLVHHSGHKGQHYVRNQRSKQTAGRRHIDDNNITTYVLCARWRSLLSMRPKTPTDKQPVFTSRAFFAVPPGLGGAAVFLTVAEDAVRGVHVPVKSEPADGDRAGGECCAVLAALTCNSPLSARQRAVQRDAPIRQPWRRARSLSWRLCLGGLHRTRMPSGASAAAVWPAVFIQQSSRGCIHSADIWFICVHLRRWVWETFYLQNIR